MSRLSGYPSASGSSAACAHLEGLQLRLGERLQLRRERLLEEAHPGPSPPPPAAACCSVRPLGLLRRAPRLGTSYATGSHWLRSRNVRDQLRVGSALLELNAANWQRPPGAGAASGETACQASNPAIGRFEAGGVLHSPVSHAALALVFLSFRRIRSLTVPLLTTSISADPAGQL